MFKLDTETLEKAIEKKMLQKSKLCKELEISPTYLNYFLNENHITIGEKQVKTLRKLNEILGTNVKFITAKEVVL